MVLLLRTASSRGLTPGSASSPSSSTAPGPARSRAPPSPGFQLWQLSLPATSLVAARSIGGGRRPRRRRAHPLRAAPVAQPAEGGVDLAQAEAAAYDAEGGEAASTVSLEVLPPLAQVDRSLWPLLLSAAEAEAAALGTGGDGDVLTAAVSRAAGGLVKWRAALSKGRVWSEAEGADWPTDKGLRTEWTDLMQTLEMPRLTRQYPKLLEPLLASLLEAVERIAEDDAQERQSKGKSEEEQQQEEPQQQQQEPQQEEPQQEGPGEGEPGAAAEKQNSEQEGPDAQASKGQSQRVQDPLSPEATAKARRLQELMDELEQEWGKNSQAIKEADETFGAGAGSLVGTGDGLWHETASWKEVAHLRAVLSHSPQLRELVRNLGRRSATRGPPRRIPEELFKEGGALGVIRSSAAPAEANGVCLGGEWETMLPSEAQLLASGKPMLRALHHARRIERSLLSYDRAAWLEEEALRTGRNEMRPFGKAGPLIVCLDTSGSMMGARETLSKALVLECLRQAHKQKRRCYLYAFSGQGQLQELELNLSEQGLRLLLSFLKFSFSGGTSLDGALQASARRLQSDEQWGNADMLIVTDGELDPPKPSVLQDLAVARLQCGTRVVGIVLGENAGKTMQELCTELFVTGSPERTRSIASPDYASEGDGVLRWPKLRPVPVQERVPVAAGRSSASKDPAVFAGSSRSTSSRSRATPLRASRFSAPSNQAQGSQPQELEITRYSDSLVKIIEEAENISAELGLPSINTDAFLLALLTQEDIANAAFPEDPQGAVAYFREQVITKQQREGRKAKAKRGKSALPRETTPAARRALFGAETESRTLSHDNVEPAHLLLALMREEKGEAMELILAFKEDPVQVQYRVLGTLSGPLARIKLTAMNEINKLRETTTIPEGEDSSHISELVQRLAGANAILTRGLVERSVEAKLLLLAALSGEHLFLLGPPGTAKSLLARRLALVCQGRFFERLLTRFSVPEEVFGPLSLKALENDELLRKVEGFLPAADVAFLDEVFKANSSILNALLTLLNERVFDNGGSRVNVPLWCAVAASNELPESDELDALFDRFLLRREVPRVSDDLVPDFLRSALVESADSAPSSVLNTPLLTEADSEQARSAAASVDFPDHLLQMVADLRTFLRDKAEPPAYISDRRIAKAVRLIRLAAYAAGGKVVTELDLLLLQHVFWDKDPAQAFAVVEWILERCGSTNGGEAEQERDIVSQASFFLVRITGRLRRRPTKQATIAAALRDLQNLRAPLEAQLAARWKRLAALQEWLKGGQHRSPRVFWLEESERERAAAKLLPSAESAAMAAEDLLREVLQLQGALEILEDNVRERCIDGLLADSSFASQGGGGLEDDAGVMEKWAKSFSIPDADLDPLLGPGRGGFDTVL